MSALLAVLVALGTAGFAWRWPMRAALAVVALLPAYQVRFVIFGVPSTVLEFVILGVLVGSVAQTLARHRWRETVNRVPRWVYAAALLWLGVGLVGVAVAEDTRAAVGLWRAYFLEPLLLLPLWWALGENERGRRELLGVFSAQLLFFFFIAVFQWFGVLSSPLPWSAEHPPRFTGSFAFPNALALYAAPVAVLLMGAWVRFRGAFTGWESKLWITASLSGFFTIALAGSEGALVALAASAVVLGAWAKRRWVWWGVCAALAVVCIALPVTREKITSIVTAADTSTDVRVVLWRGTWRMLAEHPLTGAGLGGFPQQYNQYRLPQHVELLQYPHNLFLNVWSELGALGLLVALGSIFVGFFALSRQVRQKDPWAVPILCAWLTLLVHGLVDVPYFKNDLAVLTVLLAILPWVRLRTHSKIPPA